MVLIGNSKAVPLRHGQGSGNLSGCKFPSRKLQLVRSGKLTSEFERFVMKLNFALPLPLQLMNHHTGMCYTYLL